MTAELYDDVVGQPGAVAQLRAASRAPVHAYLFVGPPGTGKRAAARSFAASLLCRSGGCGSCRDCRLARREVHPDMLVVEREGAYIRVEQAAELVEWAALAPVESARKVAVLVDFHLVREVGPMLLKTIEEPPASVVFVVLADDVPPELVTIASRCVRVDFGPVPTAAIVEALVAEGVEPDRAAAAAAAAGGRVDRARLLARDPGFARRRAAWRAAPGRLDGTGATVARVVAELLALVDEVEAPLAELQAAELAALDAELERYGDRAGGEARRRRMLDRHRREKRRLRTDELRFGLATLAGAYRDLGAGSPGAFTGAVAVIDELAATLAHNPREELALWALFCRLDAHRLPTAAPAPSPERNQGEEPVVERNRGEEPASRSRDLGGA
jgi:DNA polymerase-3 subunit delta'